MALLLDEDEAVAAAAARAFMRDNEHFEQSKECGDALLSDYHVVKRHVMNLAANRQLIHVLP